MGGKEKRNKEVHSLHIDRALRENNVYIHIKVKKMISSFLLKEIIQKKKNTVCIKSLFSIKYEESIIEP